MSWWGGAAEPPLAVSPSRSGGGDRRLGRRAAGEDRHDVAAAGGGQVGLAVHDSLRHFLVVAEPFPRQRSLFPDTVAPAGTGRCRPGAAVARWPRPATGCALSGTAGLSI